MAWTLERPVHGRVGGLILSLTLVASAVVVACSDDDKSSSSSSSSGDGGSGPTGSSSSGGSSGGSSGSTTASSTTSSSSSSGSTQAPETDLTFEADFIGDDGPNYITGTITLPDGASADRTVQIEVIRTDGINSGNQLGPAGKTKAGGSITYKVTALSAGTYKIGVRVDQTNNMKVNDPGDYIGFARGTTAAPKTTKETAETINVTGPVTAVDIGLGVVP